MALGIFTSPLRGSLNILPLFTSISKNNCSIFTALGGEYKAKKITVVNWVFCQSFTVKPFWKYSNIQVLMTQPVPGSQIVGKTRKKKAREKLAGWKKGKRKGERACNHLFYDPLPPTFGTFEIIRFRLPNCWNVNELESFSSFSRDYFARRLSLMDLKRDRAIWSLK